MSTQNNPSNESEAIIKQYMLFSLGTGVVPVPFLDIALLSGIQLKMIHCLSKHYDVPFSEERAKPIIGALIGSSLSVNLGANVGRLLQAIIPLGRLLNAASLSLLAAASTYALGKVFTAHFETGGTLLTLDPEKIKGHYTQAVEEGKQKAANFSGIKP